MKKVLVVVLCLILVLSAIGCSSGVSQEDYDALKAELDALKAENEERATSATELPTNNEIIATKEPVTFNQEDVLSKLEIVEYQYNYKNDYFYIFLAVKNNSDQTIDLTADMVFMDADNNIVGTNTEDTIALEPGFETALSFQNDEEFATHEYKLTARASENFDGVLSSLESEVSLTDKKAILSVTNNGTKPAEFVEYTMLFMDGETVVDNAWGFCIDDDSEIKPGDT